MGEAQADVNGDDHAFLWQDGVMRDLGTLGGAFSRAYRISEGGDIIGMADITGGNHNRWHAFLWQNGKMNDIGNDAAYELSDALGINANGDIVGYARGAQDQVWYAVRYENGAIVKLADEIDATGWTLDFAYAINDAGVIVGRGTLNGSDRGFQLNPD